MDSFKINSQVFNALQESLKNDNKIDQKEFNNIKAAISEDGKVDKNEKQLLEAFQNKESVNIINKGNASLSISLELDNGTNQIEVSESSFKDNNVIEINLNQEMFNLLTTFVNNKEITRNNISEIEKLIGKDNKITNDEAILLRFLENRDKNTTLRINTSNGKSTEIKDISFSYSKSDVSKGLNAGDEVVKTEYEKKLGRTKSVTKVDLKTKESFIKSLKDDASEISFLSLTSDKVAKEMYESLDNKTKVNLVANVLSSSSKIQNLNLDLVEYIRSDLIKNFSIYQKDFVNIPIEEKNTLLVVLKELPDSKAVELLESIKYKEDGKTVNPDYKKHLLNFAFKLSEIKEINPLTGTGLEKIIYDSKFHDVDKLIESGQYNINRQEILAKIIEVSQGQERKDLLEKVIPENTDFTNYDKTQFHVGILNELANSKDLDIILFTLKRADKILHTEDVQKSFKSRIASLTSKAISRNSVEISEHMTSNLDDNKFGRSELISIMRNIIEYNSSNSVKSNMKNLFENLKDKVNDIDSNNAEGKNDAARAWGRFMGALLSASAQKEDDEKKALDLIFDIISPILDLKVMKGVIKKLKGLAPDKGSSILDKAKDKGKEKLFETIKKDLTKSENYEQFIINILDVLEKVDNDNKSNGLNTDVHSEFRKGLSRYIKYDGSMVK